MTSPYLSKPTRSIRKALDDRGMTANDIGLGDGTSNMRKTNYRYLVVAFACLIVALGVVSLTSTIDENLNPEILTAEEADKLSDEMSNIMPAAGNESSY